MDGAQVGFPVCCYDPVTSTWNVDSAAIGKSKAVWFAHSLQAALLIDLFLGFWGFGFPNDSPAVPFLFDQKERTLGMLLYAISVYLFGLSLLQWGRDTPRHCKIQICLHKVSAWYPTGRPKGKMGIRVLRPPIKKGSRPVLQIQIKCDETGCWTILERRLMLGNHFNCSQLDINATKNTKFTSNFF